MKRLGTISARLLRPRNMAAMFVAAVLAGLWWNAFESRVAEDFEAAVERAPTRVYARPFVLAVGDRFDPTVLQAELHRGSYRRVTAEPAAGEYRMGRRELRLGRRALRIGGTLDPAVQLRIRWDGSGRIRSIRDAGGESFRAAALEPVLLGKYGARPYRDRIPVQLEELPAHLVDLLLAVEDRRFYEHEGLDFRRIAGALAANARAGSMSQGGSTITQQLARTLFLRPRRSLGRKVHEALIAVALERRVSKPAILEAYLNHIYLGQDGKWALHGVGAAARHYFSKDASELTLGESAMLVGIIRGPSVYSPGRHPDRARARRNLALQVLAEQQGVDPREAARARGSDLGLTPGRSGPRARYYMDWVGRELLDRYGLAPVETAGFDIITALDPRRQGDAQRILRDVLDRLEERSPALAAGSLQGALVAIEPETGEVVAMVGGRSYGASQFNRAVFARRQPGSAFKPLVALAALASGPDRRSPFTLASRLEDEPLRVSTPQGVWAPRNADGEFFGPVTLRQALEESRNVPFARVTLALGPERVVDFARRLGIDSPLTPVPSLALGSGEVTLLELTGAYATLAAEGRRTPPHGVRAVLDRDAGRLDGRPLGTRQVVSPAEAFLVTSALRGVVDRGTGTAVRAAGFHGDVAAKSGTTNQSKDAWFVGYTPELAVGVWIGRDDGRPIGWSGSEAALPVFAGFMRAALGENGGRGFRMPAGVEVVDVDLETGRRAGWGCRAERQPEVFLAGTEPDEFCGERPWSGRWERRAWRSLERDLRSRIESLRRRGARVRTGRDR